MPLAFDSAGENCKGVETFTPHAPIFAPMSLRYTGQRGHLETLLDAKQYALHMRPEAHARLKAPPPADHSVGAAPCRNQQCVNLRVTYNREGIDSPTTRATDTHRYTTLRRESAKRCLPK